MLGFSCNIVKEMDKKAESTLGKPYQGTKQVGTGLYNVGDALFSGMSLEEERAFGEAVALQAYATDKFGVPVKDAEVMMYMNCMANVIGQHSERPMIPYHAAVIKSNEINAFSTPGGYIFVTSGLVALLDNEAQLAMVVGHEIAHIAQKHAVDAIKKSKVAAGFSDIFKGGLTVVNMEKNMDQIEKLIIELAGNLIAHDYDSTIEIQSDLAGVSYAMKAGYNPSAMMQVIEKLKVKDTEAGGSHPKSIERLDKLTKWLEQRQTAKEDNPDVCAVVEGPDVGEAPIDFSTLTKDTDRFAHIKQLIQNFDEKEWDK
jgi:predicted Zn-dependent protease